MKHIFSTRFFNFNTETVERFITAVREDMDKYLEKFEDNYFTVKIDPAAISVNISQILRKNSTDQHLRNCWKVLEKSKNFKEAQGWQVTYSGTGTRYDTVEIEIIFSPEYQQKLNEERDAKFQEVRAFYDSLNYKGD